MFPGGYSGVCSASSIGAPQYRPPAPMCLSRAMFPRCCPAVPADDVVDNCVALQFLLSDNIAVTIVCHCNRIDHNNSLQTRGYLHQHRSQQLAANTLLLAPASITTTHCKHTATCTSIDHSNSLQTHFYLHQHRSQQHTANTLLLAPASITANMLLLAPACITATHCKHTATCTSIDHSNSLQTH